jgi:predicted enzyme related to lactoylglutathione lyase
MFRVILEVADLDSASVFYTKLFGTEGRPVPGGRHYFDCGGVIVALLDVATTDRSPRPMPNDCYFAVKDLDAIHARATTLGCLSTQMVHGEEGGEIVTRPWGERSFYAKDPFGNGLCFVDDTSVFTGSR